MCIPKIPTCGLFRIGVDIREPNTPPFVIVNVPPCSSFNESLLSRAFLPNSRISLSISAKFNWFASRTTGTTNPSGAATAIPIS